MKAGGVLTYTLDEQLRLHLAVDGRPVAQAAVVLEAAGRALLAGEAEGWTEASGTAQGTYHTAEGSVLRLRLEVERLRPEALALRVSVENVGAAAVAYDRFCAPQLRLVAPELGVQAGLWTLLAAATAWGQDFAFPLTAGFSRDNFLGHLQDAEGGGVPLVYFWKQDGGLALMHIETKPKDWYQPVQVGEVEVATALEWRAAGTLQPGERLEGLHSVISWHEADFFAPLALYRELLAEQGLAAPLPVPADFEPGWCSWGYEFDVHPDEVLGVLPVLEQLGIRWLTLDDRWFDAYADWNPRRETFPNGAADMRRMTAGIHAAGGFAQLWWYPLCVEDGAGEWESHRYGQAQIYREHPDWLVLNADGSVARNNRHLAMLCPALAEVQEYTRRLTQRFIEDWGFDGHKLDNIYTMPPCHNPAHHHTRPEESSEALAEVYRIIFETTRRLRPDSVTQICPCGTPLTFSLLPYTDQTVTADPTSSAQVRQRIKFYKALSGPYTAVFADHVELSDGGVDFASGIGAGGVPATKFIWPDDAAVRARLNEVWALTDEKRALWQKWLEIYHQHRPAQGEYLNLYDLAFDVPETHVIRKGERLYYALYAGHFAGPVTLRGLEKRSYRLVDYVVERELGQVSGDRPQVDVAFEGALLMMAIPA